MREAAPRTTLSPAEGTCPRDRVGASVEELALRQDHRLDAGRDVPDELDEREAFVTLIGVEVERSAPGGPARCRPTCRVCRVRPARSSPPCWTHGRLHGRACAALRHGP